jgi:LCP family protein required for cell wall assembly
MSFQGSGSRPGIPVWFWRALGFASIVTLFVASYLVHIRVRDFFASQQSFALADSQMPVIATPIPGVTPVAQLPRWDGHERVNVLLLGIDERGGEEGPWRTDTMLLLTLDPVTMSAGILSIPRDLWVTIPGHDVQDRINIAHFYGDVNGYPGGGPALARDTVTWNLGVPIHYYVRVNFTAFETAVDEIGGIDIYVPEAIDDPFFPSEEGYGHEPFHIEAGQHHLDGKTALKYARTRATFGADFDRGRRQQDVILAVRDQVMKLDQLPQLIAKAPMLMETLGDAVRTDMSLEEANQLARLASEIEPDQIVTAVIDHNYTSAWETPDGAQVLIANREATRQLRDLLFAEPQVAGDSATVSERLDAESARILILNGSETTGLARSTSDYLVGLDFQVVDVGDAGALYDNTLILDYAGKRHTSKQLATLLKLPLSRVLMGGSPDGDYDIALILGSDFELPDG